MSRDLRDVLEKRRDDHRFDASNVEPIQMTIRQGRGDGDYGADVSWTEGDDASAGNEAHGSDRAPVVKRRPVPRHLNNYTNVPPPAVGGGRNQARGSGTSSRRRSRSPAMQINRRQQDETFYASRPKFSGGGGDGECGNYVTDRETRDTRERRESRERRDTWDNEDARDRRDLQDNRGSKDYGERDSRDSIDAIASRPNESWNTMANSGNRGSWENREMDSSEVGNTREMHMRQSRDIRNTRERDTRHGRDSRNTSERDLRDGRDKRNSRERDMRDGRTSRNTRGRDLRDASASKEYRERYVGTNKEPMVRKHSAAMKPRPNRAAYRAKLLQPKRSLEQQFRPASPVPYQEKDIEKAEEGTNSREDDICFNKEKTREVELDQISDADSFGNFGDKKSETSVGDKQCETNAAADLDQISDGGSLAGVDADQGDPDAESISDGGSFAGVDDDDDNAMSISHGSVEGKDDLDDLSLEGSPKKNVELDNVSLGSLDSVGADGKHPLHASDVSADEDGFKELLDIKQIPCAGTSSVSVEGQSESVSAAAKEHNSEAKVWSAERGVSRQDRGQKVNVVRGGRVFRLVRGGRGGRQDQQRRDWRDGNSKDPNRPEEGGTKYEEVDFDQLWEEKRRLAQQRDQKRGSGQQKSTEKLAKRRPRARTNNRYYPIDRESHAERGRESNSNRESHSEQDRESLAEQDVEPDRYRELYQDRDLKSNSDRESQSDRDRESLTVRDVEPEGDLKSNDHWGSHTEPVLESWKPSIERDQDEDHESHRECESSKKSASHRGRETSRDQPSHRDHESFSSLSVSRSPEPSSSRRHSTERNSNRSSVFQRLSSPSRADNEDGDDHRRPNSRKPTNRNSPVVPEKKPPPKLRPCLICQSTEHLAKECKDLKCYRCNQMGHFAKECPNPATPRQPPQEHQQQHSSSGDYEGPFTSYAGPSKKALSTMQCFNCEEYGHAVKDCQYLTCKKCGGQGHFAKQCTRPPLMNQMKASQSIAPPSYSIDYGHATTSSGPKQHPQSFRSRDTEAYANPFPPSSMSSSSAARLASRKSLMQHFTDRVVERGDTTNPRGLAEEMLLTWRKAGQNEQTLSSLYESQKPATQSHLRLTLVKALDILQGGQIPMSVNVSRLLDDTVSFFMDSGSGGGGGSGSGGAMRSSVPPPPSMSMMNASPLPPPMSLYSAAPRPPPMSLSMPSAPSVSMSNPSAPPSSSSGNIRSALEFIGGLDRFRKLISGIEAELANDHRRRGEFDGRLRSLVPLQAFMSGQMASFKEMFGIPESYISEVSSGVQTLLAHVGICDFTVKRMHGMYGRQAVEDAFWEKLRPLSVSFPLGVNVGFIVETTCNFLSSSFDGGHR